ncbi:hypothetical protein [Bosea sp. (in: a-proteobacteria)]|jgi:hypothetical protein|uniref:hypothetical protein n=1 Tax=Bosea sp. (in: a-proteobacteria) TaxID=1871050 RepID=UPI002DDD56F7|nr:hypothetical protein [Bosea sp. (in: a-proteobacteria)]HEV2511753.1 hypothetical protein [Bosea sp. (in: a-proteobacteria)]
MVEKLGTGEDPALRAIAARPPLAELTLSDLQRIVTEARAGGLSEQSVAGLLADAKVAAETKRRAKK